MIHTCLAPPGDVLTSRLVFSTASHTRAKHLYVCECTVVAKGCAGKHVMWCLRWWWGGWGGCWGGGGGEGKKALTSK